MKKIVKLIFFLSVLAFGSGLFLYYSFKEKKKKEHKNVQAQKAYDFYRTISNLEDFKEIQGAPLSDKFNDVWSIKLVYDMETDQLYYVKSQLYRYHFEFCNRVLHYSEPLEIFNILNYGKTIGRRFYLANLNYYVQSKQYTLEFTSDDLISADQIEQLFREVGKTSYLSDSLHLLVSSDYLASLDQRQLLHVPRIYPAAIYKGQQYQALQEGKSFGILRYAGDPEEDFSKIGDGDILITKGTPVSVPVCAGIVTNMFQTPLSHINILCHNRKIPSAVALTAWERKEWTKLNGQPICMTVSKDSLSIIPATMAELETYRKTLPERKRIVLKGELGSKQLIPVKDFGLNERYIIGNKAAGLGELYKISAKKSADFEVPEGAFAIPFSCYKAHMDRPEIKAALDKILKDDPKDKNVLHEELKALRKLIKAAPIDPQLLQQVSDMIRRNSVGNSYRFRSSSNAEDREGFSGAGLYESKTGKLGDTAKSIEKAIKAVWASAWNDEAYLERRAYNVDQASVLMGVLAHRNFPDEKCNGVAITKNIYRPDFPGMTINVQAGEVPVVSPPDSVTCEQFVCVPVAVTKMFSNDIAVDYLTYSNITQGKRVLTHEQITQLYEVLSHIVRYYHSKFAYTNNYDLDIEFKFDKNNKLYIKQVRPYY